MKLDYPPGEILSRLFDFRFERFAIAGIVKSLYALSVVLLSLWAIFVAGFGIYSSLRDGELRPALVALVTAPAGWIFGILAARTWSECLIVAFRIADRLREIADLVREGRAAAQAPAPAAAASEP